MIFEIIKDCRNFVADWEYKPIDATRLYTVNYELDEEFPAFRLLIPDGKNMCSLTYTRVIVLPIYEANSKTPLGFFGKLAREMTEPTFEEKCIRSAKIPEGSVISQTVYIFIIKRMLGTFHSRRVGNDIYLFFNSSKLTRTQIEYRIKKILGSLFLKRAEKIVEATKDKIGKEPYGYLAEVVEFFRKIGEKLFKRAMRYFRLIESPTYVSMRRKLKRLRRLLGLTTNNAIRNNSINGSKQTHVKIGSGVSLGLNKSNSNIYSKHKDVRSYDERVVDDILDDVIADAKNIG